VCKHHPYAPGGGFDVYVRVIAPVLAQFLPRKVSIVPVNVAGRGGSQRVFFDRWKSFLVSG
jgi:tripartite-type tricarboxylate transporter receptor subunit TctC